jgi:hypothetical protein
MYYEIAPCGRRWAASMEVNGSVVPNWQLPRPWCHEITGRRALHHQPPRAGTTSVCDCSIAPITNSCTEEATQTIHSRLTRLVYHCIGPTVPCHVRAVAISHTVHPHTRLQLPAEARVSHPTHGQDDAIHATMAEKEPHELCSGRGRAGRRLSGGAIRAGEAVGG